MTTFIEFICDDTWQCGWVGVVRMIPATRTDPACLATDPPDCCPDCGGDVTENGIARDREEYEHDGRGRE